MTKFNKGSRKKFFKMTALTLAMVTAMSMANPCEARAASGSFTLSGKTVHTSLNGSSKSISASTSYTWSTGVVNVKVKGYRLMVSNPEVVNYNDESYREASAPGGVSASISINNNDWVYFYGQSTHGAKNETNTGAHTLSIGIS